MFFEQSQAPIARSGLLHTGESECDAFRNIGGNVFDLDADLLHRVAVAHGDAAVLLGLKVDRDAERGADLVFTAIALADRTGVVKINSKVLGELLPDGHGLVGQLFGQRQYSGLERRKRRMQAQHGAHIVLAVLILADDLFIVSIAQEGEGHAVRAERRLDDVGNILLVGLLIEVLHGDTRGVLVLGQVEVRAVGNAPQLAPAEREQELDVGRGVGVMGQLLRIVVAQAEVLILHTERQQPVVAVVLPVLEPLEVGAGLAEELKLHLLELTGTEGKVAGCNLIAERLAHLADAEGDLLAGGALDVLEVDENALRGLRTEIDLVLGIFGNALIGLEHQVELADIGKIVAAAVGARDLVLIDIGLHLLVGPAGRVFAGRVLDQLIRAVTGLAVLAVHQRVREAADMAGSNPGGRVHQDRRVQTDVVWALLHELLAPRGFDVVFKLHAERAVVPGVGKAAVDLRAGIHEATALAQGYDFVHCLFAVFHFSILLLAHLADARIFSSRIKKSA